jgi:hypothetical protein
VRVDRAELLNGDTVCIKADTGTGPEARHWRLARSAIRGRPSWHIPWPGCSTTPNRGRCGSWAG